MNNIYKDYCYEVFDIETKKENINNDKYNVKKLEIILETFYS